MKSKTLTGVEMVKTCSVGKVERELKKLECSIKCDRVAARSVEKRGLKGKGAVNTSVVL